MKILVVDDEALLVKGIRFNLKNEGYDVITGSNGLEAVTLAQDPDVGLILLDVMMPVMDGLTACSKIREFSDVPIILLTAKVEDMDKLWERYGTQMDYYEAALQGCMEKKVKEKILYSFYLETDGK